AVLVSPSAWRVAVAPASRASVPVPAPTASQRRPSAEVWTVPARPRPESRVACMVHSLGYAGLPFKKTCRASHDGRSVGASTVDWYKSDHLEPIGAYSA